MATPPTGFPQAFGKYRLLRKLARGGMAELFLATDPSGQPVVIKRVLPHFTQETEFLKMFLNEARIAALLSHPGIVKVFDLGMEGEHLYIAMEFVDGFDLETLAKLAGGKLPPGIAARVGADVCEALYYANRMTDLEGKPLNVVHRDVTPGNVMITRRGQVKLVDFGVAKAAAQLERTRPGVVKGKFRYMSPEQINFKELDGRSDLFSLGVLLYEVCTAERPFERKQLLDIINALTHYTPPPPAEVVKGFPKPLSIVIMHALEKDRETRYKHGREMQTALEQAIRNTPTTSAELAAFIAELAKKHPKELAPVAPEFDALPGDRPQQTAPNREQPKPSEADETSKIKAAKANKNPGELRTEALSGDQVKRMIAEADRRHAASLSQEVRRTPPGAPNRVSGRQPFTVGPPEDQEATAMGLGDDDGEETTTDPVARRRPSSPSVRKSGPPPPAPPLADADDSSARTMDGRGVEFDEDEPRKPEEGPDTLKVRQPASRSSQRNPAVRPATPRPAAAPPSAPVNDRFDPREFGDDDDVEVPTISNVKRPGASRPPVVDDPDDDDEASQVSAVSSVTNAERRSSARAKVLLVLLVLSALALLGWFAMVSFAPQYVPEQLRDGVYLGKQPLSPAKQPSDKADKPDKKTEAPGEPAPDAMAAAPAGAEEAAREPEDSAPAAEPAPGSPSGQVFVEGPAGTKVSIGGRAPQDVPFELALPPGSYKCAAQARGQKKKPCHPASLVVEAGKKTALKVP